MIRLMRKFLTPELLKYAVSGGAISAVNFAVFYLLFRLFGIHYTVANIAALILSKTVGYLLNKLWVFESKTVGFLGFLKEFVSFFATRGLTGLVDYFGLILLVEIFGWNKLICKVLVMALVIVLNYVFGKFFVFKKKKPAEAVQIQLDNQKSVV